MLVSGSCLDMSGHVGIWCCCLDMSGHVGIWWLS